MPAVFVVVFSSAYIREVRIISSHTDTETVVTKSSRRSERLGDLRESL